MSLPKVRRAVNEILELILISLMAANVFNVLWQVFSRFALRRPSSFTEETARYLLIWLGLLGASYATGKKMHLAIDILLDKWKGRAKTLVEILIQAFIFSFALSVLVIGGFRLVIITLALNQTSAALHLKLGYVYTVLPLSGMIIMFFALDDIILQIRRLSKNPIPALGAEEKASG